MTAMPPPLSPQEFFHVLSRIEAEPDGVLDVDGVPIDAERLRRAQTRARLVAAGLDGSG